MGIFATIVVIVSIVSSLDRSETSVVPGGDVTGPTDTGPTVALDTGSDDWLPHSSGGNGR